MKIAAIIVVTALLLVSASNTWAARTPQHSASGVIQSIDVTTETFTLAPTKGEPLVFVWKDYSRLIQSGRRVCFGVLKSGQTIKISYRRDIGQLVPYWVYLPKDAEAHCECCEN